MVFNVDPDMPTLAGRDFVHIAQPYDILCQFLAEMDFFSTFTET